MAELDSPTPSSTSDVKGENVPGEISPLPAKVKTSQPPFWRKKLSVKARIWIFGCAIVLWAIFLAAFGYTWREDDVILHPARTPIDHPLPPDLAAVHSDVQLTTEDNVTIRGWYVPGSPTSPIASPSGKTPVLILLHGIGSNRAEFNVDCRDPANAGSCDPSLKGDAASPPFSKVLHDHGYGLLMIDLRVHGESGGDFCSYGLYETRDVAAALTYLQNRPDVDAARIGIFGKSLGSMVAIRSAARLPGIRAVGVEAPFADLNATLGITFHRFTNLPEWGAWPVTELALLRTGLDIRDQRPIKDMPALGTRPFYAIGDMQDTLALPGDAQLLYDASQSPNRQIWNVADAGHTMARTWHWQEFDQKFITFFDGALK